jgi:hypothetical protein
MLPAKKNTHLCNCTKGKERKKTKTLVEKGPSKTQKDKKTTRSPPSMERKPKG